MIVTLIRHGTAQAHAHRDRERALTSLGRQEARQLAVALARQFPTPALVICSPFVRAVQTAEIVVSGIGYAGVVQINRGLRPDSSPDDVVSHLATLTELPDVLLVAHEPILSSLSERLLGGAVVGFRCAEALRITFREPGTHESTVVWRGRGDS